MTSFFRSSTRLEAFSDAVFAIAITLLILEIRVPSAEQAATPELLWKALQDRWPSYFAFLLSFGTILIAWIGHHLMLQGIVRVSQLLVWVNGLFLLLMTVLPFTTALVAEHLLRPSGTIATAVYAGLNVLNCMVYLLLARLTQAASLRRTRTSRFRILQALVSLVLSGGAVALAFVSPIGSLLLVAATWIWWCLPSLILPADEEDIAQAS